MRIKLWLTPSMWTFLALALTNPEANAYELTQYYWCPDPAANYCPGQTIYDRDPALANSSTGCTLNQNIWIDDYANPTGPKNCITQSWAVPVTATCGPRPRAFDRKWIGSISDCDPLQGTNPTPPSPTPGPGSGGGTPPPPPPAQPLVLLGGNGILDCPVGAVDCGPCPPNTGSSDAASCGASAFSNAMIESLARQAATSTVSDENLKAAGELEGRNAGID